MDLLIGAYQTIGQSRVYQWALNKCRSITYPWVYNSWEADSMSEDYGIFLGSLESACDREALRERNIHRVVSAVYDIDAIFPDDPELLYLKVPVIDKPTANIAKHFERAVEFIHEGVTGKHKGEGVLVHCVFGVSRSSTIVCAYLIMKHNMPVADAIRYVQLRRPRAKPNTGFLIQLQKLNDEKNPQPFSIDEKPPVAKTGNGWFK